MSVLTIHPSSEAEENALKAFFDTFNVKYELEVDETDYLMAGETNRLLIDKSIKELEAGKGRTVSLDDLWK